MLDSVPVLIAVSTVLGFLSGIGVGGGSLLILWLTLALHMDYSEARIINLLFFLPSALIATLFRWRQGKLKITKILPAIALGCAAAGICAMFSNKIDIFILKKLFGILLLLTGVRELTYRPQKRKGSAK